MRGLSEVGAYIADLGYACTDTERAMLGVSFTHTLQDGLATRCAQPNA